ncbi:hypothetical protein Tco_0599321 [Tanacetum coccineum]
MADLLEDIQCASTGTRPPMLDRTDFASWQQQGAQQLGPERARVYLDLLPEDKDRYNADIQATNILLQWLPKYIYTLINYYTEAKDIWDNVKMLLEGSELTKEDRKSQLYDDFEHFRQNKGETIHDYYVRFAKLINDMRNIKMAMSRMQLNSKFVNNMLSEWGRFVTAVKLNRGLRDSNYDQLYAYLKQHEAHANENKMMLDRFTQHTIDPLALMSNVSQQQYYSQSSTTPPSTHLQPHFANNTQLDSRLSLTDNLIENLTNTLALLTQSYKTYLPQTNNQLRTSSNPRNQATVQEGRVVVQNVQGRQNRGQSNNARGAGITGYGGAQNRVGNANPGQARQVKCYKCNAQENRVALDEEHLLFLAGGRDNVVDEDVDEQPIQDLALNVDNVFQADDCYAFDSDVEEAPTAQTMFMANLSSADPVYDEAGPSYDSNILSEEQVELYERRARKFEKGTSFCKTGNLPLPLTIRQVQLVEEGYVTLKKKDFKQKENKYLEDFLDMKALKEKVEDKLYKQDQSLQTVHMLCKPKPYYDEQNKVAIGYKNPLCLTRAKQVQLALYNGHEIIKTNHVLAIVQTRKHDEIERKNLLIANDNLISDCLSKDVFYIAMNSELTVARFTEMHVAHTVVQARCLELKAELSKLLDNVQKDDHTELVKWFFPILEVNSLNLRVNSCTDASGSQPRSNTKNNRILPVRVLSMDAHMKDIHFRRIICLLLGLTYPESCGLSRTDHPLVFGFRLLKTYDRGLLTAQEFVKSLSGALDSENEPIWLLIMVMEIT